MGIDIYAKWADQTEEEQEAQHTGFDVTCGHLGYLREAYHGAPYATRILVPEAFNAPNCEAAIPAATLRARLPEVIAAAMERERVVYKNPDVTEDDPVIRAFTHFVVLCEAKEAETGQPVTIFASY